MSEDLHITGHAIYRMVSRKLAPNNLAATAIIKDMIDNGRREGYRIYYGGMVAVVEGDKVVTIYPNEGRRK
jgi:hypothetical protein